MPILEAQLETKLSVKQIVEDLILQTGDSEMTVVKRLAQVLFAEKDTLRNHMGNYYDEVVHDIASALTYCGEHPDDRDDRWDTVELGFGRPSSGDYRKERVADLKIRKDAMIAALSNQGIPVPEVWTAGRAGVRKGGGDHGTLARLTEASVFTEMNKFEMRLTKPGESKIDVVREALRYLVKTAQARGKVGNDTIPKVRGNSKDLNRFLEQHFPGFARHVNHKQLSDYNAKDKKRNADRIVYFETGRCEDFWTDCFPEVLDKTA